MPGAVEKSVADGAIINLWKHSVLDEGRYFLSDLSEKAVH